MKITTIFYEGHLQEVLMDADGYYMPLFAALEEYFNATKEHSVTRSELLSFANSRPAMCKIYAQ